MSNHTVTMTIDDVVYTDIIPKYQRPDFDTEEILYGDELRENMQVIVAPAHRQLVETSIPERGLLKYNRWCTVTRLRMDIEPWDIGALSSYHKPSITVTRPNTKTQEEFYGPGVTPEMAKQELPGHSRMVYRFMGVYNDGSVEMWTTDYRTAWIVKKSSR